MWEDYLFIFRSIFNEMVIQALNINFPHGFQFLVMQMCQICCSDFFISFFP